MRSKKNIILKGFLICALFLKHLFPYAQITFQKTYGDSLSSVNSVLQTIDGGYIITGSLETGSSGHEVYVMKTSSQGDNIWMHTYGNGENAVNDLSNVIQQTSDGGYIITGETFGENNVNVLLLRLNPNGDILWRKFFIDSLGSSSEGVSLELPKDGGYILGVTLTSFNSINYNEFSSDIGMIKTDSLGNILWSKRSNYTNSGTISIWCNGIKQTLDNGYICAVGNDVAIIKLNSSGDTSWTRHLGIDFGYTITSLNLEADSGYFITVGGYKSHSPFICKVDKNGNSLWAKATGGFGVNHLSSICPTKNNGYVIVDGSDIIKINNNADTLWGKNYIGYYLYAVKQTSDNGYIIAGQTSGGAIALIKTDSLGNSECNQTNYSATTFSTSSDSGFAEHYILYNAKNFVQDSGAIVANSNPIANTVCVSTGLSELSVKNSSLQIYPNPANESAVLNYKLSENTIVSIVLYDILGNKTTIKPEENQSSGEHQLNIDTSALKQGMYFCSLILNGEVRTSEKLIVIH